MAKKIAEAIFLISLIFLLGPPYRYSLPLSTNGRWIVDARTGQRVKLTCVNWPSHLETMLAEGLDKRPLSRIVSTLSRQHFNCVRFTWATYMFTRYANRTVLQSLNSLNLTHAVRGIYRHNRVLLSETLVQAFETVVDEFGAHNLMVALDNHVSRPTWCCTTKDGNGFFGDSSFDAKEWLQGLAMAADRFKGKPHVIAISTRNELRGAHQNEDDWYKYMYRGGETIHKANPDVLIFVSGLVHATDLTYLKKRSLGTDFNNKLVYEAHWYPRSLGTGSSWGEENVNEVCRRNTQLFIDLSGFVVNSENPIPMFVGEFGLDQRGLSLSGERFLACFLAYAADNDLDWGLWAWQGSYYYRQNKTGTDETFGVMDFNWDHVRNPQFQNRLQLIKRKLQDPSSRSSTSYIMFHPQSGSCTHTDDENEIIYASSCHSPTQWTHDEDGGPIRLKGSNLCLKVVRDGLHAILSTDCSSQQSSWKFFSETKLHLGAQDENGEYLCLHKDSPHTSRILTTKCIFINEDPESQNDPKKDPITQWFKFVKTNINAQ